MGNNEDEYLEELRVVRRKKDTHRSNSSKSDEFESDLLRSNTTKNVAGPTESRAVDEDELRKKYQGDPNLTNTEPPLRELTPGQKAVADALAAAADAVIRELVVPLIRDVAAPIAREKMGQFVERRRTRALERTQAKALALEAKVAETELTEEATPEPTADVDVAESSIAMTRSDQLLAQLQLKLAEDYVARQRWLLQHAEVTGDDITPELEESLSRMVEGRANELSEDEREAVAIFLRQAGAAPNDTVTRPVEPPHRDRKRAAIAPAENS